LTTDKPDSVRREVLYELPVEFHIPVGGKKGYSKRVSNETFHEVHAGKHV
jgi:hypothetical protein